MLWGCSQGSSESAKEEIFEISRLGMEISTFRFADSNARQESSRRSVANLREANAGSIAKPTTKGSRGDLAVAVHFFRKVYSMVDSLLIGIVFA